MAPPSSSSPQSNSNKTNNNNAALNNNNNSIDSKKKTTRKPRFKPVEHQYPVEPRIIQVIKNPKTYMDHSYRDFSQVPPTVAHVGTLGDDINNTKIEDMSFAQKVYHILSLDEYSNWIHWLPHGRAFKIAVPKRLEQSNVIQKYFGHNRFSSFLRMLNNFGFKHISIGIDRNSYYHECMLRGLPHLLQYMPHGRDSRRLVPDPDNEPDFYAISRLFPLPPPAVVTTTSGTATTTTCTTTTPSLPAAVPSPAALLPFISTQVQPMTASSSSSSPPPPPPPLQLQQLQLQLQQQLSGAAGLLCTGPWRNTNTAAATAATNMMTTLMNTMPETTSSSPTTTASAQQMALAAAFKKDPDFSSRYLSLLQGATAAPAPTTSMTLATTAPPSSAAVFAAAAMQQPSLMTLRQLQQAQQQQLQQQQQYHDPAVLAACLLGNNNMNGGGGGTIGTPGVFSMSSTTANPSLPPFGNLFQG